MIKPLLKWIGISLGALASVQVLLWLPGAIDADRAECAARGGLNKLQGRGEICDMTRAKSKVADLPKQSVN